MPIRNPQSPIRNRLGRPGVEPGQQVYKTRQCHRHVAPLTFFLVGPRGFGPRSPGSKPGVLPLDDRPMVRPVGLEPTPCRLRAGCSAARATDALVAEAAGFAPADHLSDPGLADRPSSLSGALPFAVDRQECLSYCCFTTESTENTEEGLGSTSVPTSPLWAPAAGNRRPLPAGTQAGSRLSKNHDFWRIAEVLTLTEVFPQPSVFETGPATRPVRYPRPSLVE